MSIELLHLGLQRLLKVGLTLPIWQLNHPYKCEQCAQQAAPDGQTAARFARRCHWRYMPRTPRTIS